MACGNVNHNSPSCISAGLRPSEYCDSCYAVYLNTLDEVLDNALDENSAPAYNIHDYLDDISGWDDDASRWDDDPNPYHGNYSEE